MDRSISSTFLAVISGEIFEIFRTARLNCSGMLLTIAVCIKL